MIPMLDICCCAGGASVGYARAGFLPTGVDVNPQPSYPYEFYQADLTTLDLDDLVRKVDARFVHVSAPCQKHTTLNRGNEKRVKQVGSRDHVDLITPTRPRLNALGLPWVMENVMSAPLRRDLWLCGDTFGLDVIRHRKFEFGGGLVAPVLSPSELHPHGPKHRGRVAGMRHGEWFEGPYFQVYGDGGGKGSVEQWQKAMGIDWTSDRRELAEAIPPVYTEFIGTHIREQL